MMSILVPLKLGDWHPEPNGGKGYFRCQALALPSAEVVCVRLEDEALSHDYYEIRGSRVHWKGGIPPGGMHVELALRRRLLSARETFLAGILGLLIGAYAVAYQPERIETAKSWIDSGVARIISR
jgi:hypothetical protein